MSGLDLVVALLAVLFIRSFVNRWRYEWHNSFMWDRQHYGWGRSGFKALYAAWMAVQP